MTDPAAAYRAARRAAVKQHHPDRGGSSEALAAALAAVEQQHHAATRVGPVPGRHRSESPAKRLLRSVTHRARRLLPRSVPGSRRYIQL